jgi:hypothetical protein
LKFEVFGGSASFSSFIGANYVEFFVWCLLFLFLVNLLIDSYRWRLFLTVALSFTNLTFAFVAVLVGLLQLSGGFLVRIRLFILLRNELVLLFFLGVVWIDILVRVLLTNFGGFGWRSLT